MGLPALPGAQVLTVAAEPALRPCVQAGGTGATWTLSLVSVPGPVCLGGGGWPGRNHLWCLLRGLGATEERMR